MSEMPMIFIGKRPTMNYVLAVMTEFNSGANRVVIKARGRVTAKAIDVAEIVKNRFLKDGTIEKMETDTESFPSNDGRTVSVSSLEITLLKA